MSKGSIRRKKSVTPKTANKRKTKRKPDIFQKLQAQVSQETILEENLDNSDYLEPDVEPEEIPSDEVGESGEQLIDYDPEEVDIDEEEPLGNDKSMSIFDTYEAKPFMRIRSDIILDEIIPYNDSKTSDRIDIDVYIPSKKRLIGKGGGKKSKEHAIRTEALERIGALLANQDKGFLLGNVFNPALITQKRQKDIARSIGKDETWITRLKQSCVVQTSRWGLQPLSIFFPEETLSSIESYSRQIVDSINNEDPLNPLSIEELARLVSQTEVDYKNLTTNAGSKLRRILEKLSIPPPKARMNFAKAFTRVINEHENADNSQIIEMVKASNEKWFSETIIEYSDFSEKLIQRLSK